MVYQLKGDKRASYVAQADSRIDGTRHDKKGSKTVRRLTHALLFAFLLLFGVANVVAAAPPPMLPGMPEAMMGREQDIAELSGLTGKDFEIAYMQKMRMHHLSAIEMAKLIPGKAIHPELAQLAQTIISDQQKEIGDLESWLKTWYGITPPAAMPGMNMPGMDMPGMDMMMAAMMKMTGADLEQAFLLAMVHHHQGAVDMSALAAGRTTRPELLQFANNVITVQQREIAQMRNWAMTWYNFDPVAMNPGGMPMPGMPNTGGGGARQYDLTVLTATMALVLGGAVAFGSLRARRQRVADRTGR